MSPHSRGLHKKGSEEARNRELQKQKNKNNDLAISIFDPDFKKRIYYLTILQLETNRANLITGLFG